MTYFATAFTLNICGIRLRFRLDLDDEPEPAAVPHHVRAAPEERVGKRAP